MTRPSTIQKGFKDVTSIQDKRNNFKINEFCYIFVIFLSIEISHVK